MAEVIDDWVDNGEWPVPVVALAPARRYAVDGLSIGEEDSLIYGSKELLKPDIVSALQPRGPHELRDPAARIVHMEVTDNTRGPQLFYAVEHRAAVLQMRSRINGYVRPLRKILAAATAMCFTAHTMVLAKDEEDGAYHRAVTLESKAPAYHQRVYQLDTGKETDARVDSMLALPRQLYDQLPPLAVKMQVHGACLSGVKPFLERYSVGDTIKVSLAVATDRKMADCPIVVHTHADGVDDVTTTHVYAMPPRTRPASADLFFEGHRVRHRFLSVTSAPEPKRIKIEQQ